MSNYWPNPGTAGSQLSSMYDRIAADVAPKAATSSTEVPTTNGQADKAAVMPETGVKQESVLEQETIVKQE